MKSLLLVLAVMLSLGLVGCGKSKEQIMAEREAAELAARKQQEAAELAERKQQEAAKVAEMKQLLIGSLKDPGSAQLTNLQVIEGRAGTTLCGKINAKNSYGGYVGARPFVVTERPLLPDDGRRVFTLDHPNDWLFVKAHEAALSLAGCPTS